MKKLSLKTQPHTHNDDDDDDDEEEEDDDEEEEDEEDDDDDKANGPVKTYIGEVLGNKSPLFRKTSFSCKFLKIGRRANKRNKHF